MTALFPHHAETAGVTVKLAVAYLADQSSPDAGRWFWSYHVRVENQRGDAVRLLARHWVIENATGKVHEVRGEGVVGDTLQIDREEAMIMSRRLVMTQEYAQFGN